MSNAEFSRQNPKMLSSEVNQEDQCPKQIRRSEVPEYLRGSELFLSLSDEGDDDIEVPSDCMKMDLAILNAADLESLLMTMRFWILVKCPNALMDFLLDHYSEELDEVLGRFDVEFNLRSMAKELQEKDGYQKVVIAVKHGRPDFMFYLISKGIAIFPSLLVVAAEYCQLECLRLLYATFEAHGTKYKFSSQDYQHSIKAGKLDCLVFLVEHGESISDTDCIDAARFNSPQCLRYLLQHSPHRDTNISWNASFYGFFECLQCAVEFGCGVNNDVLDAAVKSSETNTACLEYVLSLSDTLVQLNEDISGIAIYRNRVAALRILHAHHCPMPTEAVHYAALTGSVESLIFLAELGYDCYVPSTMATAAQVGLIEFVKHLQEQGCVWDESAPMAALQEGKADCLAFFLQLRGIPQSEEFQLFANGTTDLASQACRDVIQTVLVAERG